MRKYDCHKTVEAAKIIDWECEGIWTVLIFEEAAPVRVSMEYMMKHEPQFGGYYVRYENGYESFSPADAFESGYTPQQ